MREWRQGWGSGTERFATVELSLDCSHHVREAPSFRARSLQSSTPRLENDARLEHFVKVIPVQRLSRVAVLLKRSG
jgi:hypothetical protein